MAYQLPLEITREDQIWMARSSAIQGFLATGDTLDQLFQEVPDVRPFQNLNYPAGVRHLPGRGHTVLV